MEQTLLGKSILQLSELVILAPCITHHGQLTTYNYYEKDNYKATIKVSNRLLTHYPKIKYWKQLSAMYGALEQTQKELMALEFQYNMQLKGVEVDGMKDREKQKEDRKDERTKIQATQQSEMIDQRNSGKPPKNFESAGNDILGGGFDLGAFEPR